MSFLLDIHIISSPFLNSFDPDRDSPVLSLLTGEAPKHEAESVDRRIQRIQQCSRDPWRDHQRKYFPTCMRDVM